MTNTPLRIKRVEAHFSLSYRTTFSFYFHFCADENPKIRHLKNKRERVSVTSDGNGRRNITFALLISFEALFLLQKHKADYTKQLPLWAPFSSKEENLSLI